MNMKKSTAIKSIRKEIELHNIYFSENIRGYKLIDKKTLRGLRVIFNCGLPTDKNDMYENAKNSMDVLPRIKVYEDILKMDKKTAEEYREEYFKEMKMEQDSINNDSAYGSVDNPKDFEGNAID